MNEVVSVAASVAVEAGCSMYGLVNDVDETTFVFCGQSGESFTVTFDAASLRLFIRLATDGLHEMEQRQAEESAGAPERNARTRLTLPELTPALR